MADPPPYPDTGDDTGARPGRGPTTTTPRWVTVLWIIVGIGVALLFAALHLSGSVGPGAH